MDIRIGKYRLTTDAICITLHEMKVTAKLNPLTGEPTKNPGKEYSNVLGYYTRMCHTLERLFEHSLMASEAKTLQEVLDVANETKAMIRDALGPDFKEEGY